MGKYQKELSFPFMVSQYSSSHGTLGWMLDKAAVLGVTIKETLLEVREEI
jgi:hypothetical protein